MNYREALQRPALSEQAVSRLTAVRQRETWNETRDSGRHHDRNGIGGGAQCSDVGNARCRARQRAGLLSQSHVGRGRCRGRFDRDERRVRGSRYACGIVGSRGITI